MIKITWHGHANFQIESKNSTTIIDPWFEGNPSISYGIDKCEHIDLVLVTHDHFDHLGDTVAICKKFSASVGAVVETALKLKEMGVPEEQILNGIGFNIGGSIKFKDVNITMVQAVHTSSSGTCIGYILTFDEGFCVYHAGDTGIFSSMELFGELFSIDLALLPIGGVFTMDSKQAALACKLLKCKSVIPMHWGSFPILEKGIDGFKAELEKLNIPCKVISISAGETVELK